MTPDFSNSDTFRGLYGRYYNMVLQLVKYNHGTEEEALEVIQEALILLFENVRDGKFGKDNSEKTWIYSYARSQWLKRLRTRGKEIHFHDAEDYVEVKEEFDEDARKEMLRSDEYIKKLDNNSAKLLVDTYYKRINPSADKVITFSALESLKNIVFDKNESTLGPDDIRLIDLYLRYELSGKELADFQNHVKADDAYGSKVREYVKALFAIEAMGRREISLLLRSIHADLSAADGFEKYDPLFEYVVKKQKLSRGYTQIIVLFLILAGASTYMYLNGYFVKANLPKIFRAKDTSNEIFNAPQAVFDTFRNSRNEIDSIVVRRDTFGVTLGR
ncbi:MAG: sigma-70 family RNA polymerase sigma factor [Bacteroidetes bacterium]|nr:sigma-70 family RNA polymerase sigma factor [Bacteroidota bacterium]